MTERQIEKTGRSTSEFIQEVLSKGSGEMTSDERTDRRSGDYVLALRRT